MSSPSKRIKITPTRLQGSQESKVTSTPQRHSQKVVSPNISRISSSISVKSTRIRLSEVFSINNQENSSTSSSSNGNLPQTVESAASNTSIYKSLSEKSVNSSNYDEYLDDCGQIKHIGNVWKIYKPLHEESLYAQLMQEPQNGQEVVTELLLLYNRKPEVAICSLLKLCVDLCGYQNFDISEHYNFRENAANQIVEMMESDNVLKNEELDSSGRYLFMESKTQLAKILKIGIYNFLQKLIMCGHERGILYDEFFAKHFFQFVKALSFSEIRAIRHTGVVIAIKILTALVMTYSKIINDENDRCEEGNTLSKNINQQKKQDINVFLEFFYFIFVKSCRLQDNKVTLMRVECIHELSIWIKYFPKIFITQLQAINCVCKLITDVSKDVRYAALETFEELIGGPNILKTLKNFMPDFTEAVGKRFYDVDIKVVVKAIDIFTIFLKQDASLITTHRFKLLTNLVFDNSFIIGEAAARFLTCYLQINEESEHMILIQLAKFSMKPGHAIKELLVEGCLQSCSAIKNWDIFIALLTEDSIDIDITQALVEIFSESVYQTLEGHSSIMREMSPKVADINVTEYRKISKYTPNFTALLKKYRDHPTILAELLKIICLISKDILNENHCQHYMKICGLMEILFHAHTDEKLLVQIVETFNHFCKVAHFAVRAKSMTDRLCSKYANDMLANHVIEERVEVAMKVALLFAKFNLTKYFTWEALFDNWSDSDELITAYFVSCCKWYIIWSLKNLTETDYSLKSEVQKQFRMLTRICLEYISTCFNMLENLNGQHLHFIVYDSLCQVHITYMKDLEGPIKLFRQFQELKLFIKDTQLQKLLVSFLDKHVICNATLTLHEKRVYVVNYTDLIHYNVLPTEYLGYIFKYYYTYNKEFGPIIESSLESVAASPDDNILLMVIIYTITLVYENVLNKYGAVDFRTEEVKHMKLLIKQFLTLKIFRSPNRSFKKLIFFAFNYSFKDESKYSFLYFAKYFVDLLMDDDRKEVTEFFKKKIPRGAEKNDAVLYVANYIKNVKHTAASKQKQPKQGITGNKKASCSSVSAVKKVSKANNKITEKSTKKKIQNVSKKKINIGKIHKNLNEDSETEISDDLTIHDSESDDLEDLTEKND